MPSSASIATIEIPVKTRNNINSIINAKKIIRDGMRKGLFAVGSENVRHVRKLYRQPKHGLKYQRPDGTVYTASAPGEPPAIYTRYLSNSMSYTVRGYDEMEFGDKPEYGPRLELGDTEVNFKARPHLIKTIQDREKDNEILVNQAIDREIRRNAS